MLTNRENFRTTKILAKIDKKRKYLMLAGSWCTFNSGKYDPIFYTPLLNKLYERTCISRLLFKYQQLLLVDNVQYLRPDYLD